MGDCGVGFSNKVIFMAMVVVHIDDFEAELLLGFKNKVYEECLNEVGIQTILNDLGFLSENPFVLIFLIQMNLGITFRECI